jgi:hypothetical protein
MRRRRRRSLARPSSTPAPCTDTPEAYSNEPRQRSRCPLTGAAMARRVAVCRGAPRRVELTAATYGRPSLWAASQVRSPCGSSLVNSVVEM